MLKRVVTYLKKSLRFPGAMAEQAVQEKRHRDEALEIKDSKKQKISEPVPEPRADRKRKVALLIAYNGKGYYGLQSNPGFPTIEDELCKALLAVGLIPQDHFDDRKKMSFQRAARTDKGVSAASNTISLKMLLNVDNLLEKVNSELPPEIRVMDCKRTTNSFNSKNFCDARTYLYLLPTFAFAPLEESVTYSYRTTPEIMERVNRVLKLYLGTHPFHNFTSGIKAEDRTAKRYMKSIECGAPFVRNDVEFAVISILGQSFMLHQIRKMVGLCIAIVKGFCGEEAVDLAWTPEKMDVPKAPGLGLVLEKLHYDHYNKRYGKDGVHEALDWTNIQDKLDQFKEEKIFSEIIKTEMEEKVMMDWLSKLHFHSYNTDEHWYYKRKYIGKVLGDNPTKTLNEENPNSDQLASDPNVGHSTVDDNTIVTTDSKTFNNSCTDEHKASDDHSATENSENSDSQCTVDTNSTSSDIKKNIDTSEKLDDENELEENDVRKAEKNL